MVRWKLSQMTSSSSMKECRLPKSNELITSILAMHKIAYVMFCIGLCVCLCVFSLCVLQCLLHFFFGYAFAFVLLRCCFFCCCYCLQSDFCESWKLFVKSRLTMIACANARALPNYTIQFINIHIAIDTHVSKSKVPGLNRWKLLWMNTYTMDLAIIFTPWPMTILLIDRIESVIDKFSRDFLISFVISTYFLRMRIVALTHKSYQ